MKKKSNQIQWLEKEIKKDNKELNSLKIKLINEISGLNKEDILPKPPEQPKKMTLWQRIRKVLMG
jgi:hypothetical protein